jgi:hypothetical protein
MTSRPLNVLTRRALKVVQSPDCPLFMFSLTAREIMQIADISRVSRDQSGDLIGYQRAEVRQHVEEIVDYLDGEHVIFPNPAASRGHRHQHREHAAGKPDIPSGCLFPFRNMTSGPPAPGRS